MRSGMKWLLSLSLSGALWACGAQDEFPQEVGENTAGVSEAAAQEPAAAAEASEGALTAEAEALVTDGSFNDCVCLDPSQVCDCRSGTCYTAKWNGRYNTVACYAGGTFLYNYQCRQYVKVGC